MLWKARDVFEGRVKMPEPPTQPTQPAEDFPDSGGVAPLFARLRARLHASTKDVDKT